MTKINLLQEITSFVEQSENLTVSPDNIIRYNDDELQTKAVCDTNDIIRSTLEYLPDEILLDVINYLKPYDIYHSLHK